MGVLDWWGSEAHGRDAATYCGCVRAYYFQAPDTRLYESQLKKVFPANYSVGRRKENNLENS